VQWLVPAGRDSTCPASVPSFGFTNEKAFLLGPMTASGATVSNLVGVTNTAPTAGQAPTVQVIDNSTGTVLLSCTVPVGVTFCTNTGSAPIPAGDYFEVNVVENGFPTDPWTVSLRY
jgi:hypothetical protein